MSDSLDIERFVKDPGLLIRLCCDVIERIKSGPDDPNEAEKEVQLIEIARTIERLEKVGVSVPEALRSEKMRLVASLGTKTKKLQVLNLLADEFEDLLRGLKEQNSRENDLTGTKKPRGKRSRFPKTDKKILRENIIKALRTLGNRARVIDVLDEMERQLNDKLLPGDLVVRQDGKTIVWRNNAQWERLRMTRDGTLCSDSPNGIWELSEDHR